jgi:hypothetical protein
MKNILNHPKTDEIRAVMHCNQPIFLKINLEPVLPSASHLKPFARTRNYSKRYFRLAKP